MKYWDTYFYQVQFLIPNYRIFRPGPPSVRQSRSGRTGTCHRLHPSHPGSPTLNRPPRRGVTRQVARVEHARSAALPCATPPRKTVLAAAWRRDLATPTLLWKRTGRLESLTWRCPTWWASFWHHPACAGVSRKACLTAHSQEHSSVFLSVFEHQNGFLK